MTCPVGNSKKKKKKKKKKTINYLSELCLQEFLRVGEKMLRSQYFGPNTFP